MADKSENTGNLNVIFRIVLSVLFIVLTTISFSYASFRFNVLARDYQRLDEVKAERGVVEQKLFNIENSQARQERLLEKLNTSIQEHMNGG